MTSGDEIEKEEVCFGETPSKLCLEESEGSTTTLYASADDFAFSVSASTTTKSTLRDSITFSSCSRSPILEEPQLFESPKIRICCLGSWNRMAEVNFRTSNGILGQSFKEGEQMRSSISSSKVFPGPTESLAASLQRGLQIIDCHQRNSALNKSSISISFEHLTLTPCPEIEKGESCDQIMQQKKYCIDERTATLLCESCCKKVYGQDYSEIQDSLKSSIETAEAGNPDGLTDKVPKDNFTKVEEDDEKLKQQMDKLKKKNTRWR